MIHITVKECDSTQEIALKELKTRPSLDAVWVRSLAMSKGRGRRGRSWHCIDGNLFLSGAYRIKADSLQSLSRESNTTNPHWPFVSLIMAHALARSLEKLGYWKESLFIKWPNDLWGLDPQQGVGKIGGILSEIKSGVLVVGMGLNTIAHPEDNPEYPTLDLAQLGAWKDAVTEKNRGFPKGELQTAAIAKETSAAFDEFFREWLKAPHTIQEKITSELWDGFMKHLSQLDLIHLETKRLLKATGLDPTGALKCIYKDNSEETLVIEGEVALKI